MAKQPTLKQQLIQELANQQVAQYRQAQQQNDDIAQLQAQYNAWQNEQEVAALQQQYDAWIAEQQKAQQPVQTVTPEVAQPIAQPVAQKAQPKLPSINMEDYQRQQQEEQMLAGNNSNRLAKEKAIKQAATNETLNRLGVMSQIDLAKTPTAETKANMWLDPNYKLTNEDKQAAREYAQSELAKYDYNSARQPILTDDNRQHYADMVNLLNKTNAVTNALTRSLKQPSNLAKAVRDVGRDVGNQITGLGAAIGDKMGLTEGATQRHNENVAAKNAFYNQNDESMQRAYEGAKTQNPLAAGIGEFGGNALMYTMTEPLFGAAGAAAKLGKAGAFALNQVGQNVQDIALDTLPTLNQLVRDGELSEEDKRELLIGMGVNAAGNLAWGGLGLGLGALNQNKAAKKAANEAFQANVREGGERLARLAEEGYMPPQKLQADEIARLNTNPLEENNKQFSDLMNTFNSQFKDESAMKNIYSPEDLDASQNAQLKALMEENLIPENDGIRVYRGFNRSDNPLEKNLAGEKSVYDALGKNDPNAPNMLPLNFYTESIDDAAQYANADKAFYESLGETARRDAVARATENGSNFNELSEANRDTLIKQYQDEAYRNLTGRNPDFSGSHVDEVTINPKKVLDISDLDEKLSVDDMYNRLSELTGVDKNTIDDRLMLSNIADESGMLSQYQVLRNTGQTAGDFTGTRFVDFMLDHGYDAIKHKESGVNHYVTLNNAVDTLKIPQFLSDATIENDILPYANALTEQVQSTGANRRFEKAYEDLWDYIYARRNVLEPKWRDLSKIENELRSSAPNGVDVDSFINRINEVITPYRERKITDIASSVFSPKNAVETVAKAQQPKLELPEETEARISSDLQQLFGKELNHDAIAIEQLGNENVTNAYKRLEKSLFDYMDSAFKAEDIEDVKAAKRAVNSARKNLERVAKREAPDLQLETTKYGYGKLVGQPEFRRTELLSPDESLTDDMVQEWLDYDKANEPNKWVRGAGEEYKTPKNNIQAEDAAKQGFNGQYNMQTFAEGPEDKWATSKLRTNSMEKTGLIKNPDDAPVKDYSYRVYGGAEQNADFDVRYADSKDVVRDLVEKDAFDEVDMRGAARQWRELMQSGDVNDIRKATRLSHKMDVEGREGGRLIEAIKEMNKNTPDGQLQDAQSAIGQAIDKRRGKGTSESLDNLYDKLSQAYEDATSKEDFLGKAKDLIKGDLKRYASPKTAKEMKSKNIRGLNDIIKMIDKAEDLSDVPFDKIVDVMYKANGGVTLSPAAQKEIYDILVEASNYKPESYENRVLLAQAARKVMAEMPSGAGDWIRAFLYDNMLGNFKTAFSRNFFGNVSYQSLEKLRELPTSIVDRLVSVGTGKRSALGWNWEKAGAYKEGFKKGSAEQFKDTFVNKVATTRSGQISWEDALKENRTIHNDNKKLGHLANEIDRYVEAAMKFGDRPIYEANFAEFKTELEQMVDRFGKDGVAGLENVKDEELQAVIDDIAAVRAADAVFQKTGKMSEGLTKLRDGLGELSQGAFGVDILSTASAPFTLTPGNMLERALEYTPVGAIKNIAETAKEVIGGTGFDQRRFVEEAGRTITGLPVLAGAYIGAKNGLVNGGYSTDPDERAAQQEDGYIEYGLNVPEGVPLLGGKTLDTSDLPVYGPFMQAGAVINENGGLTPDAALQAAEAVAGGSALQGIRRAFGSDTSSYSSQNGVVENLKNTVMSSGSQLVPSLMRQTAQTTDKYKRDLGEYGTNEYYLNLIKNGIPGLRETMPIKTNVEGEKVLQNQGRNLGSKILENYVLPMNVSEYKPSELNEEATRLRQSTGDAYGFAPKAKRSELRSWDEAASRNFTETQFRQYKQQLGKANSEVGHAVMDSKYYKELDDNGKNKALQDAYSAVKAATKNKMVGAETDDKLAKAYMKDGTKGLVKEMTIKGALKDADVSDTGTARKVYDDLGESGLKKFSTYKKKLDGSTASEDIEKVLDSSGMMKSDKAKYYSYLNTSASPGANPYGYVPGINYKPEKDKAYQKAKAAMPSLKPVDYYKTKDTIDVDTSGSISQAELLDYLNNNNISEEKAQQIWAAYGGWKNKKEELKKLIGKPGSYTSTY